MSGSPARILVVDDEPSNRDLLEQLLAGDGYQVRTAENGSEALEMIEAGDADLVLLDILMPGVDGLETCRRIRTDLQMLTLPVVFITAVDDVPARIRGKEAGGDDFLVKPFNTAELRARIKSLLALKVHVDRQENARATAQAKLDEIRVQLLRSERLATLGTLAAGVGHELNNIAVVLVSGVEELSHAAKRGEPCAPDLLEDLKRVRDHVRMHGNALLALGRPGPDYAESLDLREVVTTTLEMLRHSGRTKFVDVKTALPATELSVMMNRTRIEHVLVNLVGNAADALNGTGRDPQIRVTVLAFPAGRATCLVEDNGSGIPAEHLARIFEPYFTTKPPDRGTGLGLPVVKEIVESYGGTLSVESRSGTGTTFTFDLPRG